MSVHRLVLALPLCLTACGIVFDDSAGNSASDSDDSHNSAPHTTDPPGTSDDGGSSGGTSGSTGGEEGSSGEPTTGTTTASTGGPTTGDTSSTGDGGSTGDTSGAPNQLPPIESAEVLEKWLSEGSYKGWLNESKVHMSTGPHGGNVRTYVNDDLYVSLSNMSPMHPEGAATVKELYGGGVDEIIGYAVMVKVAPDSMGGDGWYWYERLDQTTYADGTGVGLCSGCHVGGADYVLTPFPLQ
jgi:hypothetical protein